MSELIYKISDKPSWDNARAQGIFAGSAVDVTDGFIHFSTAQTVRQTAALYYAGVENLLLIAIDPAKTGAELKWEAARSGELFPHLYASLPMRAVVWEEPMPIGLDGSHIFPDRLPNA